MMHQMLQRIWRVNSWYMHDFLLAVSLHYTVCIISVAPDELILAYQRNGAHRRRRLVGLALLSSNITIQIK